jgi:hypothetical protein
MTDWAAFQALYDGLLASVYIVSIAALVMSYVVKNKHIFRVAIVFVLLEFTADILTHSGSALFSHEVRMALFIALKVAAMVAVMWKPAGQFQQWFGSCYLAASIFFGTYLVFFIGNVDAYMAAYSGATAMLFIQIALLMAWTGCICGNIIINFVGTRIGLVANAHHGDIR